MIKQDEHHKNHRERVRERYRTKGFDSMTECEILEVLLYYAIPRKDTKPLAHALLTEFGSLVNVVTASEQRLRDAGAGNSASFFLSFIEDVERYLSKQKNKCKNFSDYNLLGKYFCSALKDVKTEHIFLVMLDSKNNYIGEANIGEGGFDSARINMRKLIDECITKKAARVAIGHNHPSGVAEFSLDDCIVTNNVENALSNIDVTLIDHFVVCGDEFSGIRHRERELKESMQGQQFFDMLSDTE